MRTKSSITPEQFREIIQAYKSNLEAGQQKALVRSAVASRIKVQTFFDEMIEQSNNEMVDDLSHLVAIYAKAEGVSDRDKFETLQKVTKLLIDAIVDIEAATASA